MPPGPDEDSLLRRRTRETSLVLCHASPAAARRLRCPFHDAGGRIPVPLSRGQAGGSVRWPIAVQSAAYPLKVSWEIVNGGTYELSQVRRSSPGSGSSRSVDGTGRPRPGMSWSVRRAAEGICSLARTIPTRSTPPHGSRSTAGEKPRDRGSVQPAGTARADALNGERTPERTPLEWDGSGDAARSTRKRRLFPPPGCSAGRDGAAYHRRAEADDDEIRRGLLIRRLQVCPLAGSVMDGR